MIIANPETKGQCGDSSLGEIWVQSSHNASGYFTIYGEESDYADHFNARLVTGNTSEVYARTGYLGFLRRTESAQQTVEGVRIKMLHHGRIKFYIRIIIGACRFLAKQQPTSMLFREIQSFTMQFSL